VTKITLAKLTGEWIPRREKGHPGKAVWGSPNRKLYASLGGSYSRFHVSLGDLEIMWIKRKEPGNGHPAHPA
jgi:hypothetical protein